jgi:hypothetical protein
MTEMIDVEKFGLTDLNPISFARMFRTPIYVVRQIMRSLEGHQFGGHWSS